MKVISRLFLTLCIVSTFSANIYSMQAMRAALMRVKSAGVQMKQRIRATCANPLFKLSAISGTGFAYLGYSNHQLRQRLNKNDERFQLHVKAVNEKIEHVAKEESKRSHAARDETEKDIEMCFSVLSELLNKKFSGFNREYRQAFWDYEKKYGRDPIKGRIWPIGNSGLNDK